MKKVAQKELTDGLAVPATATEMVEACKRALIEAQTRMINDLEPEQLWHLLTVLSQGGQGPLQGGRALSQGGQALSQGGQVPAAPAMEADVGTEDRLARFILDESVRRNVQRALQGCTSTGQVATYCRTIYDEEILPYEVLRGVDFHRAIMPLLGFRTTEAALKQAIIKKIRVA